jgi:DNA-binding NarL/FixJ family response regulator
MPSSFAHQAQVAVSRELPARLPALSTEQELVLFRVAQEALTNVARHARARDVEITLRQAPGGVRLCIADDRLGMSEPEPDGGIRGMRERALLVDGRLEVQSTPRSGNPRRAGAASRRGRRMTPLKTTVLLADDHAIVRRGLRALLDAQADFQVVGEAADGAEAVSATLALEPHLAILDVSMPRMTGLPAARELAQRAPELRMLMLSMHDNSLDVSRRRAVARLARMPAEASSARGRCVALLALVATLALAAPASAQDRPDKALDRPATASSVERPRNGGACLTPDACHPGLANDGRTDTRWSSEYNDGEYWQVDLGSERLVDSVGVTWEPAYPDRWRISTSLDGRDFSTAAEPELRLSSEERAALEVSRRYRQSVGFGLRSARYVRITALSLASRYGISIWDASVFGPADEEAPAAAPTPTPTPQPAAPGPVPAPAPAAAPADPAPADPAPAAAPAPAVALVPLEPPPGVRIRGRITRRGARVQVLTVRAPEGARVRVRCTGRSCPPRVPRRTGALQRFPELERPLRAGVVIEVFVTQPGTYGRYTRLRIRRGAAPVRTTRCVLHGSSRPVRCP